MEISIIREDDAVILDIQGRVNIQSSPELRKAITEQVNAGVARLMVKMSDVDYMDSSGVGVLVSGMKMAKQKNILFALVDLAKPVMMVIEVTRLVTIFKIYSDVPAALEQLN